jgi:hypothetical protein
MTAPWVTPMDEYLAQDSKDPSWMIEGIWSEHSHGFMAGEPKTRKSYIACDFAASVATGTDFLGYFPVRKPGAVLMVQEEIIDPELRKRFRMILAAKGLGGKIHTSTDGLSVTFPHSIPIYLRNRKQFRLDDDKHLLALARQIHKLKIELVIIDPFQMVLGKVNENHASEVRPILTKLLKIKEVTGVGFNVVHHFGKSTERDGGQRMLGSQVLHGWAESALYIIKPNPYVARVVREFRNFPAYYDPFDIEYLGDNENYEVEVTEEDTKKRRKTKPNEFEKFCLQHEGKGVKVLAKHFGITDKTMRKRVERSAYLDVEKDETKKVGLGGRPQMLVVRKNS